MVGGDRRWVRTRDIEVDGSPRLEGVTVAWDVDPTLPWEELLDRSVDTWAIRVDRVGKENVRHHVDATLQQFGWERSHGPRGAHHFPIRRAAPRFYARRVDARLAITTADGLRVAEYDISTGETFTVLEENGWLITDTDSDSAADAPLAVLPFDWPRVVRHVSQARKSAQARAEQADLAWREVLREGLLAGQDAKKLADLTGVTPQRIYQVRDGRR
jgi:hypothetical protein